MKLLLLLNFFLFVEKNRQPPLNFSRGETLNDWFRYK